MEGCRVSKRTRKKLTVHPRLQMSTMRSSQPLVGERITSGAGVSPGMEATSMMLRVLCGGIFKVNAGSLGINTHKCVHWPRVVIAGLTLGPRHAWFVFLASNVANRFCSRPFYMQKIKRSAGIEISASNHVLATQSAMVRWYDGTMVRWSDGGIETRERCEGVRRLVPLTFFSGSECRATSKSPKKKGLFFAFITTLCLTSVPCTARRRHQGGSHSSSATDVSDASNDVGRRRADGVACHSGPPHKDVAANLKTGHAGREGRRAWLVARVCQSGKQKQESRSKQAEASSCTRRHTLYQQWPDA